MAFVCDISENISFVTGIQNVVGLGDIWKN